MPNQSFQVVYLTGPPAIGKSTLVEYLKANISGLISFSYGSVLTEYVANRMRSQLTQDDLRRQSAQLILSSDVAAVDSQLVALVREKRATNHIVIDSHAVTKEGFGFRVTPFKPEHLQAVSPTMIFCLYADSSLVIERISKNDQGRPTPSPFEADYHSSLQGAVAIQYGILLGRPVYFLDASRSTEAIAIEIIRRMT